MATEKRLLPSLPTIKSLIGQYYDQFVGTLKGGAGVILDAVQNNIAASTGGAISIANYWTTINTDAGGDAFTLADGTYVGQLKKITLVVDGGGDAVITGKFITGNRLTFDTAAEFSVLRWNGTGWRLIENSGGAITTV